VDFQVAFFLFFFFFWGLVGWFGVGRVFNGDFNIPFGSWGFSSSQLE
jgi:hypothetical protein